MPGIKTGLAYIGIWLACSTIVLDASDPQKSTSELSSQNNSATLARAQSFVSLLAHLGLGNCSGSQDQHRSFGIHFGSGDVILQGGSIAPGKNETASSDVSRGPPKIEDPGDKVPKIDDGIKVKSSECCDRLEGLTNGSIATVQELRSSFDQMSERIASIDRILAGMAELTNKTLARSEQVLSAYNSTRIQLDEIKSLLRSKSDFPSDCWEIYQSGSIVSGIYEIRTRMPSADGFSVYCKMDARGGGWTVLQNRMDGSVDFNKEWNSYKNGFGNLSGEFWLGLERIHQLTNSKRYELLIELEDFDGETRFALYDNFVVSSETEKYSMQKLGNYTGTAGDSLSSHVGSKFSTSDDDNDFANFTNCAENYAGGWWFNNCADGALNSRYIKSGRALSFSTIGIEWDAWRGWSYSYKKTRMSIRPLNRHTTQLELL